MNKNILISVGITILFFGVTLAPGIGGIFHKKSEIPSPLEDGLIAYWKFDETSGNIAHDSANGFDGTVYGEKWVKGRIGNALDFDGADDFVNLPQNAINIIGNLSKGTIAFWFNYTYNLNEQEIQPLFYLGIDDENEPDNMFIIEIGHKNPANRRLYITWVINNRIPLCFDTGFNLEEKEWYHFAAVVGPNGNTGYLDGVELVNRHYNFGTAYDQYFFSDIPVQDNFTIAYGKTADGKCPHFLYYKGMIDDVRIYDTPLLADEINEIFIYNGDEFPSTPIIDGPSKGKAGVEYCWTFHSTGHNGDEFIYTIDWGDGTTNETDYYPQCEPVEVCHTYKKGTWNICAKVRNIYGYESEWSDLFRVNIPRNRATYSPLFHWFLDRFPMLERLLSLLR